MPSLRHEFALECAVTRATVYVCGLGQFELRLNGILNVNDHVLEPGWTHYDHSCFIVLMTLRIKYEKGIMQLALCLAMVFIMLTEHDM